MIFSDVDMGIKVPGIDMSTNAPFLSRRVLSTFTRHLRQDRFLRRMHIIEILHARVPIVKLSMRERDARTLVDDKSENFGALSFMLSNVFQRFAVGKYSGKFHASFYKRTKYLTLRKGFSWRSRLFCTAHCSVVVLVITICV